MRYSAVIFDMDGTLLDTEAIAVGAGLKTAQDMGFDIAVSDFEAMIGKDSNATTAALAGMGIPAEHVETFKSIWGNTFRQQADHGIPVKPGVITLLDWLKSNEIPCAVATNSSRKGAHLSLASAGLTDWFGAIVGFDMVKHPKPAPDVFVRAAQLLNAKPETSLAFEDSVLGCTAAVDAGLRVVHVPDIVQTTSDVAHYRAKNILEGAKMAGLADIALP